MLSNTKPFSSFSVTNLKKAKEFWRQFRFLLMPAQMCFYGLIKHNEAQFEEAVRRAEAYSRAGANGVFSPGLRDKLNQRELCQLSPIPVDIMVLPDTPPLKTLAQLGVTRISYEAGPYLQVSEALKQAG